MLTVQHDEQWDDCDLEAEARVAAGQITLEVSFEKNYGAGQPSHGLDNDHRPLHGRCRTNVKLATMRNRSYRQQHAVGDGEKQENSTTSAFT